MLQPEGPLQLSEGIVSAISRQTSAPTHLVELALEGQVLGRRRNAPLA
jgi:hypothetical protein